MEEETLHEMLASRNSLKNRQLMTVFWAGFILFTFGYTLSITPNPNYIICDILKLTGIGLFVLSSILLVSLKFDNKYLAALFPLLMFWQFFTILRGLDLNAEVLKEVLFNPLNGLFLYITPLILLLPRNPRVLKTIFTIITILSFIFFIDLIMMREPILDRENIIGRDMLETVVKILALPAGFLLLTYNYQPNTKKMMALAIVLLTLAIAGFRARRGLIFIFGIILIFAFLIFLYINKRQFVLVLFSFFACIMFAITGLAAFGNSNIEFVNRIKERIEEDTRTGVELYFYADMEAEDWLIGRGMRGMVAAPPVDDSSDNTGYRDGIETDYLNIILKQGSIGLGLLLLIAIPAMIKGLLFSKNSLSKAAGFWILLWLISLYPSTVTTFSMNYILVWISIGICYSKNYTQLSEETLKKYFKEGIEPMLDEHELNHLNSKLT